MLTLFSPIRAGALRDLTSVSISVTHCLPPCPPRNALPTVLPAAQLPVLARSGHSPDGTVGGHHLLPNLIQPAPLHQLLPTHLLLLKPFLAFLYVWLRGTPTVYALVNVSPRYTKTFSITTSTWP
jgi:hypothetical protein